MTSLKVVLPTVSNKRVSKVRPRLGLAYSSPERLALLKQIGIVPDLVISGEIDTIPYKAERPSACALRLATLRAEAAAALAPSSNDRLILAAYKVAAVGQRVLAPTDQRDKAEKSLHLLSGRAHRIYTGLAILTPRGLRTRVVESRVRFKRLSTLEMQAYLSSGEWKNQEGFLCPPRPSGSLCAGMHRPLWKYYGAATRGCLWPSGCGRLPDF